MTPQEYARHSARIRRDSNGCWTWTGALMHAVRPGSGGYGLANIGGKTTLLHRAFYEHLVGPIPEGDTIDHLCRNRACLNPEHMQPVTSQVNTLRGVGPTSDNAMKTLCPQGHQYDFVNSQGRRRCRTCVKAAQDAWIARKVQETGNPDWFRDYKQSRRRRSSEKE